MPRATANVQDTERKDLKSVPDGFVVLKRMTYGQVVQRRAMMKLSVQTSAARGNQRSSFQGEMAMASEEIARFEFAQCVLDHNLEDETGRKLNLSDPVDFANLDPRVGQEIEGYINDMNNFEDDEGN